MAALKAVGMETARERDRFKAALAKIASLYHPDKTCSLEAQGYGEYECIEIGITDSIAEIAKDALAGVAQDEIFSITGGLARRDKIIAAMEARITGLEKLISAAIEIMRGTHTIEYDQIREALGADISDAFTYAESI